MTFVDTNYFLRFLLADNVSQQEQAKTLFLDASEGKVKLISSTIVFFELFWVLSSFYKQEKQEIIIVLRKILNLGLVRFEEENLLFKTLELYEKENIDIEDSYNINFAKFKKAKSFKTFDKKLDKLIC